MLTSPAEIEAIVETGVARGFHVSVPEVEQDLIAVAAVLPARGRRLALFVAGPLFRCHALADEFGRSLCSAAAECKEELGQADSDPEFRMASAKEISSSSAPNDIRIGHFVVGRHFGCQVRRFGIL
jgi:hypothetical protein